MGININYSLPPHVSNEMVVTMISRIVGSALIIEGEGNSLMESSKTNMWLADVEKKFVEIGCGSYNVKDERVHNSKNVLANMFNVNKQDLIKIDMNSYWTLNVSLEDEQKGHSIICDPSSDNPDYNGRGRIMNPSANLFWGAIITRLCQAFSGKVIYNDCEDGDKPSNYLKVLPNDALYPPMKKGETELDRKIAFSNALMKIESIDHVLIEMLKVKKRMDHFDRVETLLVMGIKRKEADLWQAHDRLPEALPSKVSKPKKF